MKKFKYKFTPGLLTLIIIGMVVAIATCTINIINIVDPKTLSSKVPSYAIAILFSLLFLAFLILILTISNYEITSTELKTRLGIICTGIKLKEIKTIVHFTKTSRLSIVFTSDEFNNVIIDKKYFDSFASEIKKVAPHVIYSTFEE